MSDVSDAAIMLIEFHDAYGIPNEGRQKALRRHLIDEEAKEVGIELGASAKNVDREKLAKELADLVYVTYGCALVFKIDLDVALEQVHKSNMSKLGPDGKPEYFKEGKLSGKVKKGANYKPPDMSNTLL